MLQSSLSYILIRTFPESIVLVLSGMILLGIKIDGKKLITNGIILGTLITLIRSLPINFGVHTILSMIVLEVILYKNSNNQLIKSMLSTCMIWISLALSEGIYILMSTKIMNLQFENLVNNNSIYGALSTLPSLIILVGIIFLFKILMEKVNILISRD
ncbi:MAG: hypothetical protein ACRC3Y_12985 [Romboutsia sp.]|uniref:hypothetical protein n=1 Tax=Romboutsia sp. TaxID=1965302 RepID=UPI003F3D87C7